MFFHNFLAGVYRPQKEAQTHSLSEFRARKELFDELQGHHGARNF
jgi:hypothetical protein